MAKHKKTEVDLSMPYESNVIGLKGIFYFGIGLFLMIVITFGLMWVLQYMVLEAQADADDKANEYPLAVTGEDALPPEPRLQSAPGFGVDTSDGRKTFELAHPRAEYEALYEEYEKLWKDGEKKDDTVIALPIEEAKEKVLKDKVIKSVSESEAEKTIKTANRIVSSANSGR